MQMFEKAEQEYNELKRKKDVVEGDKARIQEVRGGAHGPAAWKHWARMLGLGGLEASGGLSQQGLTCC